MKGLGRMREFNDAKNNVKQEFENGMNEPPKPAPSPETKLNILYFNSSWTLR